MPCQCPVCRKTTLCWMKDEDAESCGYFHPGIVSFWVCSYCDAEVEVYIKEEQNEVKN